MRSRCVLLCRPLGRLCTRAHCRLTLCPPLLRFLLLHHDLRKKYEKKAAREELDGSDGSASKGAVLPSERAAAVLPLDQFWFKSFARREEVPWSEFSAAFRANYSEHYGSRIPERKLTALRYLLAEGGGVMEWTQLHSLKMAVNKAGFAANDIFGFFVGKVGGRHRLPAAAQTEQAGSAGGAGGAGAGGAGSEIDCWGPADIQGWLEDFMEMDQYTTVMQRSVPDGRMLASLTDGDLAGVGVTSRY